VAIAIAVVVVAIAALRATFGVSFFDDSYYVVVPLRLAQGARLFMDDAAIQPPGSLLAVPFVALWHALFGVNGIVLATRLFYVAVTTLAGFFVVRVLRPSFGPFMPVVAFSAVFLAPAYTTFAISYNTSAQLAFVLCVVFVFAAWRDGSRIYATLGGVFAALGCISYPPLALAALPAAVVASFVLRDKRLWLWLIGGALAVIGVAGVALLVMVPVAEIVRGFQFSANSAYSGAGTSITVLDRAVLALREVKRLVLHKVWWPAIALSFLLAVPMIPSRIRGWLAAALPLAVMLPGVHALQSGVPWTFGVPALSYLLAFTLSLVPLAIVAGVTRGDDDRDVRRLLVLGAVFSAVAAPLLVLVTSSGFVSGMAGVGATPFAIAAIIAWLWLISQWAGRSALWTAGLVLLAVEVTLLFSTAYRDLPPLQMERRVSHGAVAGIRTSARQAEEIGHIEDSLAVLTKPGSRLLVVNAPLVYLLTDAEPLTYATWTVPGPADGPVIDYFRRSGVTPDVIAVSRALMTEEDDSVPVDPNDPLLAWITKNYERVDRAGYVLFRRR